MAILWIYGSRFLPRDPKKHDHSSGITGSVGTIIIYHEWPDMLQYMDKNVKIYHISGNIILFRNGLANLSIYLLSGTVSRICQQISFSGIVSRIYLNIPALQSGSGLDTGAILVKDNQAKVGSVSRMQVSTTTESRFLDARIFICQYISFFGMVLRVCQQISCSGTVSRNRSNPHFKLSTAAFNLFKASSSVAWGQAMFTR